MKESRNPEIEKNTLEIGQAPSYTIEEHFTPGLVPTGV